MPLKVELAISLAPLPIDTWVHHQSSAANGGIAPALAGQTLQR